MCMRERVGCGDMRAADFFCNIAMLTAELLWSEVGFRSSKLHVTQTAPHICK